MSKPMEFFLGVMKIWKWNVLFLFGKHSLESDSIPPIPTLHFKRCEKKHREKNEKNFQFANANLKFPRLQPGVMKYDTNRKQAALYSLEHPSKLPQISEINFDRPKTCYLNEPFWSDSCTLFGLVLFPQICIASYICSIWFPLPFERSLFHLGLIHLLLVSCHLHLQGLLQPFRWKKTDPTEHGVQCCDVFVEVVGFWKKRGFCAGCKNPPDVFVARSWIFFLGLGVIAFGDLERWILIGLYIYVYIFFAYTLGLV